MYQTIHEAAAAIKQGQTTPIDLVEQCLTVIDKWEPKVRAWVFVDRDYARTEAKRLTEELKKGQYRGTLHGIPIGVKDIFDVFDWPTAAGSKLWANSIARQDAPIVCNLRAAGCIFLGKTVTTQFASFDPPVTRNPWNLERTPGGSSSGSAAALATGMCLGALGSQTGGSITRPASYCGVCGLKPTYGLLSLKGIVPLAPSMDHPGPMARCVQDLRILYFAMNPEMRPTYEPVIEFRDNIPRLGRLRGLFEDRADPSMARVMDEVCKQMQTKGAAIEDYPLPPTFSEVVPRHRVIMAVEGAQYHEMRLRRHPEDYGPRIRGLLEEGLACPAPEYARCCQHRNELQHDLFCAHQHFHALLTPATTGPAPDKGTTGDPAFNSPWSYTGKPTVSLPTGTFEGLPMAIQLVGAQNWESDLLRVAAWCEEALGVGPLTPPFPS